MGKKISKDNKILISLLLCIFFGNSTIDSQNYQVTFGTSSNIKATEISSLYEYDRVEDFKFRDRISDRTAYPYIETNISLNVGWYAYQAFLYDGSKQEYSTRGEKLKYQECYGDLCLVLTDRNILAISNYVPNWSKNSLHNEEIFKVKLGSKAAFVVTDRNIYFYNAISNEWKKFGLEAEIVLAVANKNDLALIVSSKRVRAIDLLTNDTTEWNTSLKPIFRYEIKNSVIDFFSNDRVFQYQANFHQVEEVRLDR